MPAGQMRARACVSSPRLSPLPAAPPDLAFPRCGAPVRATFSSGSRQDTKPPWPLPPAFLAPRRCWSLPDGVRETLSSFQDAATERHATAQSMLVGSALDWIKGHHQSTKSPCKAPSLLVILACVSYQCMFPFRFACAGLWLPGA